MLLLLLGCQPCTNPEGTYVGEALGDFPSEVTINLRHRDDEDGDRLYGVGLLSLAVPEPYFDHTVDEPTQFTFAWPCGAAEGVATPGEEDGAFRYDVSEDFDRQEWLEGTLEIEFVGTVIAGTWEAQHHVDGEEDLPVHSGDILAVRD